MAAISYVTNENGERTALLIDISGLRKDGKDVTELIEDLEDILAIELSKKENDYSPIDEVENRLRSKGVID